MAVYYTRELLGQKLLYKLTREDGFLWAPHLKKWQTRPGLQSEIVHRATGMGGDAETFEVSSDEAMKITGGVE